MDLPSVAIGTFFMVFGLATVAIRHVRPHWLRKLAPMQQRYGVAPGYAMHFVFYSVLPVATGAVALYRGLAGHSFLSD